MILPPELETVSGGGALKIQLKGESFRWKVPGLNNKLESAGPLELKRLSRVIGCPPLQLHSLLRFGVRPESRGIVFLANPSKPIEQSDCFSAQSKWVG